MNQPPPTNLERMVDEMDAIVALGTIARRTGFDQPLGCEAGCRVDATLDAVSFVTDCPTHTALRDAYSTARALHEETP